ncbi:endonuclease/exonuclease/phosphatase [Colletotrichum tabaci]|uniref:Endonuclease/exonuclease/phosphatase n=1 Tax=Colletotrichum tabaci TaxID=1209068 RepID=A0AAV9TLR5_9PEZI
MKPTGLKMLLAGGGALSSGVLAQTSGDLTVLAMNVAGLPEILQNNDVPGDKTTNSRTIGSYFAKFNYDIIHVQEPLPHAVRGPYRLRGATGYGSTPLPVHAVAGPPCLRGHRVTVSARNRYTPKPNVNVENNLTPSIRGPDFRPNLRAGEGWPSYEAGDGAPSPRRRRR